MSVPLRPRRLNVPVPKTKDHVWTCGRTADSDPGEEGVDAIQVVVKEETGNIGFCDAQRHAGIFVNDECIVPGERVEQRVAFEACGRCFELYHWPYTFADRKHQRFILFVDGLEAGTHVPLAAVFGRLYTRVLIAGLVLVVLGCLGVLSFVLTKSVWTTFLVRVLLVFAPIGLWYTVQGARGLLRHRRIAGGEAGGSGHGGGGGLSIRADDISIQYLDDPDQATPGTGGTEGMGFGSYCDDDSEQLLPAAQA
eukprot:m.100772 g.100772  ORF g.100772 m.100772 type:complete len:252 (-) comp15417_c0_seq1:92-847(-)